MRICLLILLIFLSTSPPTLSFAQETNNDKLLKVVALSRHGVRAPTQSHEVLAAWSQKPWPVWPVEKGDLTERGAHLVTAMWKNLRTSLINKGLLPDLACPPPDAIYIRADTDERTRATAYAMLEALGPNCNLGYAVMDEKVDPLFHPVKAGLYQFHATKTATDILAMTHGGLDALQDRFNDQLELLESITGPPAPEVCARFSFTTSCQLTDLPNAISVSSDGKDVHLLGSLSIASDIAEIFLLEYGQWPGEIPGWGMVSNQVLDELLPLHSEVFDVINRAPLVAWARGGFLLQEISKSLQNKHSDPKVNEAKLLVYVGHDTNIANIGALLGLNWKAGKYPENGIPPAGVLFFELWERKGKKEVDVRFYTLPMESLHSPLDLPDNLNLFQPLNAFVSAPPLAGAAVFDLEKFILHAENASKDAPVCTQTEPQILFSAPKPKTAEK